jgi:hypothetical protein
MAKGGRGKGGTNPGRVMFTTSIYSTIGSGKSNQYDIYLDYDDIYLYISTGLRLNLSLYILIRNDRGTNPGGPFIRSIICCGKKNDEVYLDYDNTGLKIK